MRFLLDQSVPDDVAAAFRDAGHTVQRRADGNLLTAAAEAQAEPVAADRRVADAATTETLGTGRLLVFLHASDPAGVGRLFARFKRLTPGRRYTVTAGKPKVGQLPHHTTTSS